MKNCYVKEDIQIFLLYIDFKKRLGVILEIIEQKRKKDLSDFERKQLNREYVRVSLLRDFMKSKIDAHTLRLTGSQNSHPLRLVENLNT